jgi:hypothetical protein
VAEELFEAMMRAYPEFANDPVGSWRSRPLQMIQLEFV